MRVAIYNTTIHSFALPYKDLSEVPFELFIASAYHLRTCLRMYCYTIAGITCICNILGHKHVCGMLTKLNGLLTLLRPLLSTGMKVRMVIFYVDIVHAY